MVDILKQDCDKKIATASYLCLRLLFANGASPLTRDFCDSFMSSSLERPPTLNDVPTVAAYAGMICACISRCQRLSKAAEQWLPTVVQHVTEFFGSCTPNVYDHLTDSLQTAITMCIDPTTVDSHPDIIAVRPYRRTSPSCTNRLMPSLSLSLSLSLSALRIRPTRLLCRSFKLHSGTSSKMHGPTYWLSSVPSLTYVFVLPTVVRVAY